MTRVLRYTSLRFVARAPGRSALAVAGVCLGVALLLGIRIVNQANIGALRESQATVNGRADLRIQVPRGTGFPEEVLARVREVAGVDVAAPAISETFFFDDDSSEALTVVGVDVVDKNALRLYESDGTPLVEDPILFVSQPNSLVLTRELARRRQLEEGSTVVLATPTGRRNFVVRGLLDATGAARILGGNLGVMDVYAAQLACGRKGLFDRIDVTTLPGTDVEALAARLRTALPPGLEVARPGQRNAAFEKGLSAFQTLLTGISSLALLVSMFLIYNTTSTAVVRRRQEIGILRALGASRRQIAGIFLVEGLVLGTVGAVLGGLLGTALARLLVGAVSESVNSLFNVQLTVRGLPATSELVVTSLIAGALCAVAATVLPAYGAARVAERALLQRGAQGDGFTLRGGSTVQVAVALGILGTLVLVAGTRTRVLALAHGGVLVLNLAVILLLLPLISPVLRVLSLLLGRAFGAEGRLAGSNLVRATGRTAVTCAALGLGFSMLVTSATLTESVRRSIAEAVADLIRADLIVESAHSASGWVATPLAPDVAAALKAVPGVERVATVRFLPMDYGGRLIVLRAVDATFFGDARFGRPRFAAGEPKSALAEVTAGRAVLISHSFAATFRAGVGDHLDLDTPSGPLTLAVAGVIVDYIGVEGTLNGVWLNASLFAERWHDPLVNQFHVLLARGTDPELARRAIYQGLGAAHRVRILSAAEFRGVVADVVERGFRFASVLEILTLVVVLLAVADTLIAMVSDRAREIATLRALGCYRRQIRRIVLVEGVSMAALGNAIGLIGGLALSWLWVHVNFPILLGVIVDLHLAVSSLVRSLAISLVIAALASWYPARLAAAAPPLAALSAE